MKSKIDREKVYSEIRQMFGMVPRWFEKEPDEALDAFWSMMRDFHLAETAIPNKYKELIGIAVAGATRCRYCAFFHAEAARMFGATDAEIAEAAMMAGITQMASTFLNGVMIDYDEFVADTRKMVEFAKKEAGKKKPGAAERPAARPS
jgi:AhpD family alkylhydroperoxidase